MWLPSPIYEYLPQSCSVAGVLTLSHADSPVLFTSGALLIAAGLMAWRLRRDSRARAAKVARTTRSSRTTYRIGSM